ncbi:hypothetical protein ACFP8Z_12185 [Gemmobacter lanyuensis]|nr:hypothetical protein [Gemmobacter lanyuensis]
MKTMRLSGLCGMVILALALGLGGMALGQTLPRRTGMVQVIPGLWVDQAASAAQVAAVQGRIAAAAQVIAQRIGPPGQPEWWVCVSPDCDRRNGMQARGMTYGASLIALGSSGAKDGGVYLHELTHATLHGALPMGGLFSKQLPLWFDEGVAVILSKEPPAAARPKACAKVAKVALPRTAAEFAARVGNSPKKALPIYTASACTVRKWLKQGNRLPDIPALLRAGRTLP